MLNVITLFSGYDSQCLALNRLGLPYNLAAWCEIDRHAITAHNALFPQWSGRNLGDVSKVDWAEWHRQHPQPIDLLTYSSPCQDFSSAGLQRGGEEGSGTRSGLLWETERAVRELRPRHLVFENVGGLVSDKFIDLFNRWQVRLNGYGYTNFAQLMNAKDYGVPQNRLRIFMVSILDCPRAYYFPQPFRLQRRLKDVLEQNVAERYYLKDDAVRKLTANIDGLEAGQHLLNGDSEGNASTITTGHDRALNITQPKGGHKQMGVLEIAEPTIASMKSRDKDNPTGVRTANNGNFAQRLEPSADQSTSNTITSVAKDNLLIEPSVLTPVRTEYGKAIRKQYGDNNLPESRHNLTQLQPKQDGTSNTLTSVAKDNLLIVPQATKDMVIGSMQKNAYVGSVDDVSPCVNAACGMGGGQRPMVTEQGIRIRRLTERELYRLMDVSEPDIDTLLAAPIPRTQHAKLAGNSIVVACLYYIFRNLFVDTEPAAGTQTKLF